jgi:hypothetical protein
MKRPSQSPRDHVLWILTNHGGRMERRRLRRCAGMRYVDLDPILLDLARESRIYGGVIFAERIGDIGVDLVWFKMRLARSIDIN